MTAAYLWFNAAMYLLLAVWCSMRLSATSKSLGYVELSASGKTEYLTLYGGMQLGLAVLFAWLAYSKLLQGLGLVLALCLYGGIVPFRLIGLLRFRPQHRMIHIMAASEVLLLIVPVVILTLKHLRTQSH